MTTGKMGQADTSSTKPEAKLGPDKLPYVMAAGLALGIGYGALNKVLSEGPVSRYFNSLEHVANPEAFCIVRDDRKIGAQVVEVYARSPKHKGDAVLYQRSDKLFSADGKPLKGGMTGVYQSVANNTRHLSPDDLQGAKNISNIALPQEQMSVTIERWQEYKGRYSAFGRCAITSTEGETAAVWANLAIR